VRAWAADALAEIGPDAKEALSLLFSNCLGTVRRGLAIQVALL